MTLFCCTHSLYLVVDDAVEVLGVGRAQDAQDVVQLVQVVLAREDGPVREHLGQDAAYRPHVDRLGVTFGVEHDLGRAVPARSNVLRQESCVIVIWICYPSKPKITDLCTKNKTKTN